MEAARRGLFDIAKLLLERDKSEEFVDAQDAEGRTALHFAVRRDALLLCRLPLFWVWLSLLEVVGL